MLSKLFDVGYFDALPWYVCKAPYAVEALMLALQVVARCALSTALGGAFGGCTALLCYLVYSKLVMKEGIWDLCAASNGALTGMVVITSGCATYEPW